MRNVGGRSLGGWTQIDEASEFDIHRRIKVPGSHDVHDERWGARALNIAVLARAVGRIMLIVGIAVMVVVLRRMLVVQFMDVG